MNKEIWKVIPQTNKRYMASNLGRIAAVYKCRRANNKFRILKPQSYNPYGHLQVQIYAVSGEKKKYHRVHQLILRTFIGKPKNKLFVPNHINGDPSDNRLENLEWVSRSVNQLHYLYRLNKNNRAGRALQIKRALAFPNHPTHAVIAKQFKVSRQTVTDIAMGRKWKYVTSAGINETALQERFGHGS